MLRFAQHDIDEVACIATQSLKGEEVCNLIVGKKYTDISLLFAASLGASRSLTKIKEMSSYIYPNAPISSMLASKVMFSRSSPSRVGKFCMILDLRKHVSENLEAQILLIA